MPYIKTSITLTPWNQDCSDVLIALMGELGYESFLETESGFEAFIPEASFDESSLNRLEPPVRGVSIQWHATTIPDQNWNEEWEKNFFKPVVINNRCLVRSPFHAPSHEVPLEIVIEPKMSFGTGHHETTRMMMEIILNLQMEGKRVLDMGCGTAILGILASKTGASEVVAIDFDPWCTNNSLENCKLNNITNMEVLLGDASLINAMEPFDVIVANINRNILLDDIEKYSLKLKKDGLLITSGYYKTDTPDINGCAKKHSLELISEITNNNWSASTYKLSG